MRVVAWNRHGGSGTRGGRPSLTDFGRWSSLHRAVGVASRVQDRTACGRGIPMPHHVYQYVRTVEAWRAESGSSPIRGEQIKLCKRCFPNGEADLEGG